MKTSKLIVLLSLPFALSVVSAQTPAPVDPATKFAKKDVNDDGKLTVEEFAPKGYADHAKKDSVQRGFNSLDANKDGALSLDEFRNQPAYAVPSASATPMVPVAQTERNKSP